MKKVRKGWKELDITRKTKLTKERIEQANDFFVESDAKVNIKDTLYFEREHIEDIPEMFENLHDTGWCYHD